jgi:hypothetical protein
MINEEIPIPCNIIAASNYRLQVAIIALRIYGRNAETMGEVYSAKWFRLNLRGAYRNSVRERRKALNNYLETERAANFAWKVTNAKKMKKVALINQTN